MASRTAKSVGHHPPTFNPLAGSSLMERHIRAQELRLRTAQEPRPSTAQELRIPTQPIERFGAAAIYRAMQQGADHDVGSASIAGAIEVYRLRRYSIDRRPGLLGLADSAAAVFYAVVVAGIAFAFIAPFVLAWLP